MRYCQLTALATQCTILRGKLLYKKTTPSLFGTSLYVYVCEGEEGEGGERGERERERESESKNRNERETIIMYNYALKNFLSKIS